MKKLRLLCVIAVVVLILSMLVACNPPTPEVKEYTVTFKDGESVLKTETVKEGECAQNYTPVKDGFEFVGWFGEPTLTHAYDLVNQLVLTQ